MRKICRLAIFGNTGDNGVILVARHCMLGIKDYEKNLTDL